MGVGMLLYYIYIGHEQPVARAGAASMVTAMMFGVINFLCDNVGQGDPSTSTALVGALFGGTCGFIADQYYASEEAYACFQSGNKQKAFFFAISRIASKSYFRYLVTIIMDTAITLILLKPLMDIAITWNYFRCSNSQAMANALVSAVIGVVTFQAYANQSRLQWAYPPNETIAKKETIHPGAIFMSTTAFVALFFIANTGNDGINSPVNKNWFILGTLSLLYLLNFMGWDKAEIGEESLGRFILEKKAKWGKITGDNTYSCEGNTITKAIIEAAPGIVIFIIITCFSVIVTANSSPLKKKIRSNFVSISVILFTITVLLYFAGNRFDAYEVDENGKVKNERSLGMFKSFGWYNTIRPLLSLIIILYPMVNLMRKAGEPLFNGYLDYEGKKPSNYFIKNTESGWYKIFMDNKEFIEKEKLLEDVTTGDGIFPSIKGTKEWNIRLQIITIILYMVEFFVTLKW